jgi:hypothetical protein
MYLHDTINSTLNEIYRGSEKEREIERFVYNQLSVRAYQAVLALVTLHACDPMR